MLVAGTLGAELFVSRVSIIFLIAGAVLFVAGFDALRILAFPIAFLLLMVPPPAIIFNQIAFPLQLLASRFGEATLQAFSIPVLREGNVITLANTTLEVAEACSGIRSLISLLTLGIVYGYFVDPPSWRQDDHRVEHDSDRDRRQWPSRRRHRHRRALLRCGGGRGVLPHVLRLDRLRRRVRAAVSGRDADYQSRAVSRLRTRRLAARR